MSEPAEASMMNVVPMPPRRPSQLDEFAELFAAAYPQVVPENLYHSNRAFDWAGNVAWSPDGSRIAVRTRIPPGIKHRITEISAEDGRVIAQHPDDGGWLIWPARKG